MTSTEKVRATLAGVYNGMLSMGVDGFRIDAAKPKDAFYYLIA